MKSKTVLKVGKGKVWGIKADSEVSWKLYFDKKTIKGKGIVYFELFDIDNLRRFKKMEFTKELSIETKGNVTVLYS